MNETQTTQPVDSQAAQSAQQDQTTKPVPIEVKWKLPSWMLRHPGPRIKIEDDDVDFQEGDQDA